MVYSCRFLSDICHCLFKCWITILVQLFHAVIWISPPSQWSSVTPEQIDCSKHQLCYRYAAENCCKFLFVFCHLSRSDNRWRPTCEEKIRVEYHGRPYSQGRGTASLHVYGSRAPEDQEPIHGLYPPLLVISPFSNFTVCTRIRQMNSELTEIEMRFC